MANETAPAADTIHVLEKAGLGKAPYKFIGNHESKYQACPGAPVQPGSSCDLCGAAIMDVYVFRSSDNKTFKLGCECCRKASSDSKNHRSLMIDVNRVKTAHRKVSEAEKITAVYDVLPSLEPTLRALPHPKEHLAQQGMTAWHWVTWMFDHAGNAGKMEVVRYIKKLRFGGAFTAPP